LECGDVRHKLKESWIEGVGLVGMSDEEQPETCICGEMSVNGRRMAGEFSAILNFLI